MLNMFFEEIAKCGEAGSSEYVIYLDCLQPFDKVSHNIMILKCKSHGMGNNINNWTAQCLTDRKQRVALDWMLSHWTSVRLGCYRFYHRTSSGICALYF